MIAASKARARRRRRRWNRRQLQLDFARERLQAFERKLADPPPAKPDEPERLGDILAQLLSRRL